MLVKHGSDSSSIQEDIPLLLAFLIHEDLWHEGLSIGFYYQLVTKRGNIRLSEGTFQKFL